MRYWKRITKLTIGNKQWVQDSKNNMVIKFDVKNSTNELEGEGSVNLSTIEIYNLSNNSINNIKRGMGVELIAGYEDNKGIILTGRVDSKYVRRAGLDIITEINVIDGGSNWGAAKLNKTYKGGVRASYIMKELAKTIGYEIAIIKPQRDIIYKLGKSVEGLCSKNLQQLARDTKSKMYFYDNKIYITPRGDGIENGFEISKDTGLLSTPERNEKDVDGKKIITYTLSTKLNHQLVVNSFIKIKSIYVVGNYRIISVSHTDSFITELEVVEV